MLDSAQMKLKSAVRKTVAAITAFMLSLVLLTALLITGFYLLVQAAIMALSPWIGEAAAMALVGLGCVLLLAAFFWRLTRSGTSPKRSAEKKEEGASSLDDLRELIQENPLEAALTAFAVGIVQQGDPRLKSLLMQGGMELMKRTETGDSSAAEASTSSDPERPKTSAATASDQPAQEPGSTRR